MLGAFLYLKVMSAWNRALCRFKRLRQPKYLFGALAGAAYLYFFLFRRAMAAGLPQGDASAAFGLVAGLAAGGTVALLTVRMALAWTFPATNPGLRFSEAEIAFLFPAPVTRRTLIHFRLLGLQFGILFASAVFAFLSVRFRSAGTPGLMRLAGFWVLFSIYEFHLNATALTFAGVKERGGNLWAWRAGAAAAIGLYAASVLGSLYAYGRTPSARDLSGTADTLRYVAEIGAAGPLPWLLLPFKIALAPLVATGIHSFALAIVPALLLLASHYAWAVRMETAFEEDSLALAERSAAASPAAGRFGDAPVADRPPSPSAAPVRASREPFRLDSRGRPEIAFFWKNILSVQGFLFTRRARTAGLLIALPLLIVLRPLFLGLARSEKMNFSPLVVAGSCVVAGYTLLLGPQFARQDLRSDLPNADILKSYPLAGCQVALGELMAPTAILTGILWLAILAPAVVLGQGGETGWFTPALRATGAVCLAAVAPVLCLIQLLVPNTLMILFPAWYQTSRTRGGGIDVMGQRLIFAFAQLLVAVLATAPAAAAAAAVAFASQWLLGPVVAVVLATLAALAILGGEAAVGVWWLGQRFEKFDLSSEPVS